MCCVFFSRKQRIKYLQPFHQIHSSDRGAILQVEWLASCITQTQTTRPKGDLVFDLAGIGIFCLLDCFSSGLRLRRLNLYLRQLKKMENSGNC